jgi:APA family basic amino acid/polyamine antiporter
MALAGTIGGLGSGQMAQNFATAATATVSAGSGLMQATVAVAFAYEGWILATTINAELRDAKKNLPRALVFGAFIVVATYILYYIGLNGAVTTEELMASGETAAKMAFQRVFGQAAGTAVFVLIVISCLGTLNGLMLSNCRSFYALAARNQGPRPDMFSQVDPVTNMPNNAAILSLAFAGFWLLYFYGANLTAGWFGPFCFDSSELPIITLYGMYVAMFIQFMRKEKDLGAFNRLVMPALGLCGCLFMVYAAFAGYGVKVFYYLVLYAAFLLVGNCLYKKEAA